MRMIREVLRLHYSCGLSNKKISQSLRCSRTVIANYLKRAQAAEVTWPLPDDMDDDHLETLLFKKIAATAERQRPQPDCNYIHQELKKKGVTLALLWEEYKQDHPDGYQQTQFCEIYRQWRKAIDLVMRQDHKAGEKAFSDFAGTTLRIVDERTGIVTPAHLFVCSLGASSYTYARLFWHEDSEAWCTGHALAFTFFKGAQKSVFPTIQSPSLRKPLRMSLTSIRVLHKWPAISMWR